MKDLKNSKDLPENLYKKLKVLSFGENLPEHGYLFSLADKCSLLLEKEVTWYRAASRDGRAGGLLDFTSNAICLANEKLRRACGEDAFSDQQEKTCFDRQETSFRDQQEISVNGNPETCRLEASFLGHREKPLILVPDLHARSYFLMHILDFILPADFLAEPAKAGITVFEALKNNLVNLVCVGDLLHSELRGKRRWLCAYEEFENGEYCGPCMTEEMQEGLSLLCMVMELKCAFPENFHILKGNHENILNESEDGNYSFGKFANEGEMCRAFMEEKYGDDVLYVISCFEKALPLFAAFDSCIVSHGEPARAFSREELVEGLSNPELIKALTWTENGASMPGSVIAMLSIFVNYRRYNFPRYFGGHRPVRGKYALRQNGNYVQFHNPDEENIVLISGNVEFNPDRDIVSVIASGAGSAGR